MSNAKLVGVHLLRVVSPFQFTNMITVLVLEKITSTHTLIV